MRTCEAAEKRLNDLSEHLGRTIDVLRTRISIALEQQNQELLKAMDKRADLQLRMQTLVEGFSVFAITYYVFSLVEEVAEPAERWLGIEPGPFKALAILAILSVVWVFVRAQRRKIERST